MKTITKMLAGALLLISAQATFAASNLPINKTADQPQKDVMRLMKLKTSSDNIVMINIFQHYVGVAYNGSGYLYHYQVAIDFTHDGSVVANPSPSSFTLTLDVTAFAGETGSDPTVVNLTINSGAAESSLVDVYSDHALTSSDVVGYSQTVYEYNGYDIDLNYTPITD